MAAPTTTAAARERLTIDWPRLTAEFHGERTTRAVNAALDEAGLADRTLAAHFDDLAAPAREIRAREPRLRSLEELWRRAADSPVGSTLLLAWALYVECQWAWELSAYPERILAVIGDIEETWADAPQDRLDPEESELTDLLVAHVRDLRHGIRMENGLNCSCPITTGTQSVAVVTSVRGHQHRLAACTDPAWAGAVEALRGVLAAHELYFDGVARSSRTFLDVIEGRVSDAAVVEATADLLRARAREPDLADDVYASELRSHVVALVCLAARLRQTPLASLRVPQVDVTYVFPFTLHAKDGHEDGEPGGVRPRRPGRRRRGRAGRRAQPESPQPAKALLDAVRRRADAVAADPALLVTRIEETDLSDIWTHGRSQVLTARRRDVLEYEAVSLVLPDVAGIDARDAELPVLHAEVRLSALGNHHLRLRARVREVDADGRSHDAGFHALNQAIRRGSAFMGLEGFRIGPATTALDLPEPPGAAGSARSAGARPGTAPYPHRTLAAVAREIIGQVPSWLDAAGAEPRDVYFDAAVDAHTVICVGHAEVGDGDGERVRTARGEDLLAALGPMLAVPVERTASGLEEWLRYEDPNRETLPHFLGDFAPVSSVATQNSRTTCLYAPGQPDWSLLGTQEMVEFVVSARTMLRARLRQVDAAVDVARTVLRQRLERTYLPARQMQQQRLELAEIANEVRRERAKLHAEELARSSGHRAVMDRMLDLSGAGRLEQELDQRIDQLDAVLSQLSEDAHIIEDRRINLILFVVALFSLADLVGLVNDLVWSGEPPSVLRLVQLGVFALLVVGLAAVGFRAYRR